LKLKGDLTAETQRTLRNPGSEIVVVLHEHQSYLYQGVDSAMPPLPDKVSYSLLKNSLSLAQPLKGFMF